MGGHAIILGIEIFGPAVLAAIFGGGLIVAVIHDITGGNQ